MKSKTVFSLLAGCSLLLEGCATDIRVPPDPSMAIIKGTDKQIAAFNYELTSITSIDGKPHGWASHGLKVTAGVHQIGLIFNSLRTGPATGVFPFELDAGKVYRLEVFIGDGQKLFLREVLESGAEDLAIDTIPLMVTPGKPASASSTTIVIYRRK